MPTSSHLHSKINVDCYKTMGDSETECSNPPSECNSPILYTGLPNRDKVDVDNEPTQNWASFLSHQSQIPFPETQAYPIKNSASGSALDALAGFDSLLEHPVQQRHRTSSAPVKQTNLKSVARASTTIVPSGAKVRTLDNILEKVQKQNISKYSLTSQLDILEMKLLIQACGEIVPSKTNKVALCDKLFHLIESGTLNKIFSSVHKAAQQKSSEFPSVTPGASTPTRVRESQVETYVESQALGPPQRLSSLRSDASEPTSRAAVAVAESDPAQWTPVTDGECSSYNQRQPSLLTLNQYIALNRDTTDSAAGE